MSEMLHGRTAALCILAAALTGCFEDRVRPLPTEVVAAARLSVQINSPRSGITVPSGQDVSITVEARDLERDALEGVGFVARRFAPGLPTIDSAAVRFTARTDTAHTFTFRVPATFATNTQIDVYGIAFGPRTQARLSEPTYLIVARCVNGVCQ